jgi:hypothetical protein
VVLKRGVRAMRVQAILCASDVCDKRNVCVRVCVRACVYERGVSLPRDYCVSTCVCRVYYSESRKCSTKRVVILAILILRAILLIQ